MININDEGMSIDREVSIYHKGYSECESNHSFGPFIRDHYLIHFVISGKGIFQVSDKTYELSEGQAFLIYPGISTYYKADRDEPWAYYWVGFHGDSIEQILSESGFAIDNPIFSFNRSSAISSLVKSIYGLEDRHINFELRSKGLLYLLLDEIKNNNTEESNNYCVPENDIYSENAIRYMKRNYSRDIKIIDIANFLNLNRSYLTRIFKASTGLSPQQYLINLRISKAKELLVTSSIPISAVGCSVGYNDPYHFSKIFKDMVKISPYKYRLQGIGAK